MDAKRARYLRQQAELGGAEVVLSERAIGRLADSGRDGVAPAPEPGTADARSGAPASPPPSAASEPPNRPIAGSPERPVPESPDRPIAESPKHWRHALPPIPGPGLTVHPPTVALLGDAITQCESLEAVAGIISGCRLCALCEGRTNTVPGEGNPRATLMCIGEGPGANEDAQGRPFVGAAGKLLDQILAAIECPRETVFIANIVKCRPPQNRKPLPDEAAACLPYLHRQIALVRPKVLLAMGGTAAEYLLGVKQSLGALRGAVHRYGEIPLVVTYHPAALLRNPNWKKPTWDDVRIARQLLEG